MQSVHSARVCILFVWVALYLWSVSFRHKIKPYGVKVSFNSFLKDWWC